MRTQQVLDERDKDITNRLWLVLDEAHVLVPSDGYTAATEPLIDYVKRGRDAGLSLIFATQQPSAVNSKLMSQVDLTITHMLGFDADLTAATARMPTRTSVDYDVDNQKVGSLSDVIRSLGPGEAIIADGASSRAFVAKIRPRVSAHGGATPK
jgi:DNA helicase HerA-like ATPase